MERKSVGIDDVLTAIRIREAGGTWSRVIAETGFNGATLRPHINRYLSREVLRKERQVSAEDRVDSPYAVVEAVELSTESIDSARKRGMSWYGIAEALGVSEAKAKGLGSPESLRRVYAGRKVAKVERPTEPRDYSGERGPTEPVEPVEPVEPTTEPTPARRRRAKKVESA